MAKIQLVDNWRSAWRWYSVRTAGVITSAAAVWMALPDEVKAAIPEKYKPLAVLVGGVAVALTRIIHQPDPQEEQGQKGGNPQQPGL